MSNAETQATKLQVEFTYLGENGNCVMIYQDITAEELLTAYREWRSTQDRFVPNQWSENRDNAGKLIELDIGPWEIGFALDFTLNDNVTIYSSEDGGFHLIPDNKLLVLTRQCDLNQIAFELNRSGFDIGVQADTVTDARSIKLMDWTVVATDEVCHQAFHFPNDSLSCPRVHVVEIDNIPQFVENIMQEQSLETNLKTDLTQPADAADATTGEVEVATTSEQPVQQAVNPDLQAADQASPLNFGNMAWRPETILQMPTTRNNLLNDAPVIERIAASDVEQQEQPVVREVSGGMLGRDMSAKPKKKPHDKQNKNHEGKPYGGERRPNRPFAQPFLHRAQGFVPFAWDPAPANGALTGVRKGDVEMPVESPRDPNGSVRLDGQLLDRLRSHLRQGQLEDGTTVINLSASAETPLGKFLTLHARTPFSLGELGSFNSLLGLFCYITCTPNSEAMRSWAGGNARQNIRRYELNYFPGWLEIMAKAMLAKVLADDEIMAMMDENDLPYRAYYVRQDGTAFDVQEDQWLSPIVTEIAKTIKRRKGNPKARPDFAFLGRIEQRIEEANRRRLNPLPR